jgi:hypothetical protein
MIGGGLKRAVNAVADLVASLTNHLFDSPALHRTALRHTALQLVVGCLERAVDEVADLVASTTHHAFDSLALHCTALHCAALHYR